MEQNPTKKCSKCQKEIEVQENDIHAFVRYVKDLMEHPVERLIKQKNLHALRGLFSLVFEELPTYDQILNGTPKLSLPYKLSEEFRDTKSLSVTQVGTNWNQLITELIWWQKFGREVLVA